MPPISNNNIKNWIAKGYLKQAISEFLKAIEQNDSFPNPDFKAQFHRQVSLLSNRYSNLERDSGLGLISMENYLQEHNRIADACLMTLDSLAESITLPVALDLKKEFNELMQMGKEKLAKMNTAIIDGNSNFVVQDSPSAVIHVNHGLNWKKVLITVVVLMTFLAFAVYFCYTSEYYYYQTVTNDGNICKYFEYEQKYGEEGRHIMTIQDSLTNNIPLLLTGTWKPEFENTYPELKFYRRNYKMNFEEDGILKRCWLKSDEEGWVLYKQEGNHSIDWDIVSIDRKKLVLFINQNNVNFNRI